MASDELRKKWGTIFMGEREATVEQLDAMQEPARRERLKEQQQEDYLERVRAKAADRAREILGAAYAEREKVLDEARAEAEKKRTMLVQEGEALKAAAKADYERKAAELARAEAAREEAEKIRAAAREQGFQAGMEQASAELREFRAELGQSLAHVLQALDRQMDGLCASWREELVELTQTAVAAGTGWLLEKEHTRILRSLMLDALNLLEDRATVSVRVNPEDEATVSDMFRAARERVPELRQWIVNGDPAIERGGLVAESAGGSVDSRRELFRELVDNILAHLALPPRDMEAAGKAATHDLVEREVEHIAALAPQPQAGGASLPQGQVPGAEAGEPECEAAPAPSESAVATKEPQLQPGPEAAVDVPDPTMPGPEQSAAFSPETAISGPDGDAPEAFAPEAGHGNAAAHAQQQAESAPDRDSAPPGAQEVLPGAQTEQARDTPEQEQAPADLPEAWLPPLGDAADARPSAHSAQAGTREGGYANTAAAAVFAEARSASQPGRNENPSLAELEEELFPVDNAEEQEVLSHGGFLPGAKKS
ncbi:FliH/SctL family protein [Desulfovibrio sp. ZJ200]|uniref:FliH/SctL family protein n=1 Tax=Desulfovibrio sp. ZJ200 TaxID=2709792 RepID=UPI0013ECD3B3|nr:FliH/SctL family protein [Desulfovibrio sp. ZJ200]